MKFFAALMGIVQALIGVGLLYLVAVILPAISSKLYLPFSPWWGLVVGLPALAMAVAFP